MLSKLLIVVTLVLLGLKFGLRARLRELGRMVDGLVNVLLAIIVASYCLQLGIWFFTQP